jgi:hypothetical protein
MNLIDQLPSDKLEKYTIFINNYLSKGDALAGISKRLQNNGVSPDLARELVKTVALSHSASTKEKATLSVVLGGLGLFIFIIIAMNSPHGHGGGFFLMALFSFLGGVFKYLDSRKRLKYLKSIS